MAPIKFEEQLKDKLEKRSLEPSEASWAKLSERLDAEEKKTKNPWFWWMSIAAGLIIMVAVAVQTFSSKDTKNSDPILVEEDTKEDTINPIEPNDNKTQITEFGIENQYIKTENNTKPAAEQPEIIKYKSVTKQNPKVENQLVEINKTPKTRLKQPNEIEQQQSLINQSESIKTAIAQAVKEFKSENKAVTDREVDSLLKLANKELFKVKLQTETIRTVNAEALLQEVEEDMGQSFRSRVFDALKTSYETVKTAVAERNN